MSWFCCCGARRKKKSRRRERGARRRRFLIDAPWSTFFFLCRRKKWRRRLARASSSFLLFERRTLFFFILLSLDIRSLASLAESSDWPNPRSSLTDPMWSVQEEGSLTAPGAEEPLAARDGAPNVETAAANQADENAMQPERQQQKQQPEEEEEEDVLMLPAFQTGDMVVCPNPRRARLLWPVREIFLSGKTKANAQSIPRRPPLSLASRVRLFRHSRLSPPKSHLASSPSPPHQLTNHITRASLSTPERPLMRSAGG